MNAYSSKFKASNNINILIAIVWLTNGLFCKILNLVPRHKEIVGSILGHQYAFSLTVLIGIAEIGVACWVLSKYFPKECTIFQIFIILTMNIIEFTFVPDLLLWGRFNIIFAIGFCALIYWNQFIRTS